MSDGMSQAQHELLEALTGRTLAQLQDDAALNARHITAYNEGWEHLADSDVAAVRRIVAEAWAGGRDEAVHELAVMRNDERAGVLSRVRHPSAHREAAMPEGSWQDQLDYLKACITGLDLLQADAEGTGTHMYAEAVARGQQRIIAACRALADGNPEPAP